MRAVIIDGDPGVDDAVALLLAFAAPELDILAVTTVAGNVGGERTARNARVLRRLAGREGTPVHAGAAGPLCRAPVEAGFFHGDTGLGRLPVSDPGAPLADGHAVVAIIQAVIARPEGAVTFVGMGPLTNLALALRLEPALAARLGPVVVMAGARREGGNITPSAEFNVFADPHAAAIVFGSGLAVTAIGLDATHKVRSTETRIAGIEASGASSALAVGSLLRFSNAVERKLVGGTAAPLHDPCTIAWLLKPELFTTRPCRLTVETASPLTLGHTAVSFRPLDVQGSRDCWATHADADGVFELLAARLGRR